MSRPTFSVLLTDLDDTVWNWFETWYASFTALMNGVCAISGISLEELKPEIKVIHERHGTSEFSFLLQEMPTLRKLHPQGDLAIIYAEAIDASRVARRATLSLYPGVLETLDHVRSKGTLVVAYTESQSYWTRYRLKKTDLDLRVDFLYSAPDHDVPAGVSLEQVRTMPSDYYELRLTQHRHTPRGVLKPSPEILRQILLEMKASPESAVYIGDSKMKDIAMAKQAGVFDVLIHHERHDGNYDLLRDVTHWTKADVEREKSMQAGLAGLDLQPRLEVQTFAELLEKFEFASHIGT